MEGSRSKWGREIDRAGPADSKVENTMNRQCCYFQIAFQSFLGAVQYKSLRAQLILAEMGYVETLETLESTRITDEFNARS